jgi:hypothetical protein
VLSVKQKVRDTEDGRSLVITMSRTSGVAEGLYGLVVGKSGPKTRQEFHPSRAQPRVPVDMLGV